MATNDAAGPGVRSKGCAVPSTPAFPLTAVLGADQMALALTLTAVAPQVGGVLVRGEKGTAKSTAVRALAAVLPDVPVVAGCRFSCDPADPDPACPDGPHPDEVGTDEVGTDIRPARLVELPVGAGEDRLLGSMELGRALREGVVAYEPGLLAAAHRGLLYVDEVNLLPDHLVDVLLDAAAMGRSTVEREGVSVSHAARFVLVGTMNPEEGELRPQLLDRFGLTVEVAAPRDPQVRAQVVRARMAYDADPQAFAERYAGPERELAERIAAARQALPQVELDDAVLATVARVCAGFEVDGMRADLVTARTALAHAAWQGRTRVGVDDVRVAARLAIPHRRRRNPFDAPGLDEELLERLLAEHEPDPEPTPPQPDDGPSPEDPRGGGPEDDGPPDEGPLDDGPPDDGPGGGAPPPGSGPAASADGPESSSAATEPGEAEQESPAEEPQPVTPVGPAPAERVDSPGSAYRTRLLRVAGTGSGAAGRRSAAWTDTGRTVGAQRPAGRSRPLHLVATLRAAAPHQTGRRQGPAGSRVLLEPDDLRLARRVGREANLVLFCVDASGSMAARRRMQQVKAAVLSLLVDAYQRRDKVALVTFRRDEAELALPPTSSVEVAARRLAELPAGGRTPLAEGLLLAARVLHRERLRDPHTRPLLVVLTDGRATSGAEAVARSRQAAEHLASAGVPAVVLDCESGPMTLGLARVLAGHLRAEHLSVGEVAADHLTAVARQGVA